MRILIASPVRKPAQILKWFFWGLNHLETPGADIDWIFIDDNDDKKSSNLLAQVNNRCGQKRIIPAHNEGNRPDFQTNDTRLWNQKNLDRVTAFRELLLLEARKGKYDSLFLVDADLVLRPETLNFLLKTKKDIVSAVFWTRWHTNQDEMPNVWVADHYNLFEKRPCEQNLPPDEILRRQKFFLEILHKPGVYRVGGLGACTLISRKALDSGVNYQPLYNVTWWGEDRHFSLRAVALGFELWADTRCSPFHIYREMELAKLTPWLSQTNKYHYDRAGILP
jgi:hypothetical protein